MAKLWDESGRYLTTARTANYGTNTGANDNFLVKKAKSIENALGTTLAVPASFVNTAITNAQTENINNSQKNERDALFQKYGFASRDDYYKQLENSWDADGNATAETERLLNIPGLDEEEKALNARQMNSLNNRAAELRDYAENNYIAQKIGQDRGKFAGSAINTLSTASDVLGLTNGPVANAIQGGIEGVADELEENGLQNFDWGRAGRNAAVGAASGAAVGTFNNALAKNGGKLFAGNNALSRGINNAVNKYGGNLGRTASNVLGTVGQGAMRGAASGAVGGAVGGGVGAALNGQDVLSGAAQGLTQGARQGLVAGGTMAGANLALNVAAPRAGQFLRQTNQSAEDWQNSGRNFNERLTNTLTSGNSAVGEWLQGNRQSGMLNRLGTIGNTIIMEDGKPKVFYHGSPNTNIDEFDLSRAGSASRSGEKAIYFTDDRPTAEEFSYERIPTDSMFVDQKGKQGKVYERYLDLQNPIDFGKLTDSQIDELYEYASPLAKYDGKEKFVNRIKEFQNANNDQLIKSQLDLGALQNSPYDGFIARMYPNQNEVREYGLWDSSKIIDPETRQQNPTTLGGWLKRAGERAVEDLNNRGAGLSIKDVNGDGLLNPRKGEVVETPAQKTLAELSDGQYKTVGDMVDEGLDLQTIKSALSKRNYDELVKNVREIADINRQSYDAVGVKSKSDLPVLNREQYYEDTLGKVKGNDYVSYRDVPDYMKQHLSNPATSEEAMVRGSNDEILRDLFKDDTSPISDLYERYEKLAQGNNANEIFTGKNINDALVMAGPELEKRITTELANNLFGDGRKIKIDSTGSNKQNVLVKNLALPRDIKNMTINNGAESPETTLFRAITGESEPIRTTSGYTAEELIKMANGQKQQFVDDVRAITAENDGIPNEAFFDTAVKTNVERINQKIKDKNGRAPTDMLRSTIMVKDPNTSLDSIIKSFEDRGYKIWNNDITNRYTDGSTGYKDIALKLVKGDNDNIVKEIQIMTPNMQKAKYELGGHELYEKVRVKAPGWEEFEAQMNQLYADAERADLAALNSSADTSRPSFNALRGGNSEPVDVYPATSSPSNSTLTGVPSTMKYRGNEFDAIGNSPFNSSISQKAQDINSPDTELYRTVTGQTEPQLMYGESKLGNRTRRGMIASGLERFGNTLEGAQTNLTRSAEKDLGIESAGKVVENVRRKTGIVNLETQAALAKELTGGADSLMDNVQRMALGASENGQPYKIDTTDIARDIESIVDKYADTNMFGSQTAKNRFISNLRQDITNYDSDVLSIANRMKAIASDLWGKGVVDPPAFDKAKAKIYSEVAARLDDASYKAIPQENVEAMFDTTIAEMRGRAQQAAENDNKDVAKAYTTMADALDAEPRTIKAFRSFKKDFVDISKVAELTARAENGAAVQMGRSFGGSLKRFGNTLLQRPVNAALAKAGSAVNSLADRIDNGAPVKAEAMDTVTAKAAESPANQPTAYDESTQLYNMIGRSVGKDEGEKAASGYIEQAAQAMGPVSVASTGDASTALYNTVAGNNSSVASNYNTGLASTGDYWTDLIGRAMMAAAADNDVEAFGPLYEMYQNALADQQKSATSEIKLTDKQRQANAAERALNDFETAEHNFAYDVSDIPVIGAIANLGGNEYASKAEALALQIGYMLSGATVNAQEAKNIGMAYIPQPRDNEAVRRSKLAQIRGIISDYQKTYEG